MAVWVWIVLGLAYLCLGLFFITIPLAVLTVTAGALVGVGVTVWYTAAVLLGDERDILITPDDHVAASPDGPMPADFAWVGYFVAQVRRDAMVVTLRSFRWFPEASRSAWRFLRDRDFSLSVAALAVPVTVPVLVGWLFVPVGTAAALAVAWAAGAVVTGLVWSVRLPAVVVLGLVDGSRRRRHRADAACPYCYHVAPLPAYLCPGGHAGGLHYDLRRHHQGVWLRRCACGESLPTGVRRARRRLLRAYCPLCREQLSPDAGVATDVRIALLGTGGAGKTSLLAATVSELADRYDAEGTRFAAGNRASRQRLERLRADFRDGRRVALTDPTVPSAGLLLHVVRGHRRALLQFFDTSGDVFEVPTVHDDLAYVEYARTLLLVVDPFALETVRAEARETRPDLLEHAHAAGRGPEQAYQGVTVMLRNSHVAHRQRLAVVVTKTDLLRELKVGESLGHTSAEIRDWLVRQREDNLVLAATRDFRRVRYFRCSSVRGGESPLDAVRWLLSPEPFPFPAEVRNSDD